MTKQRLLLVSPVRNEAAHLDAVIAAIEAQARKPDLWLVVDDGSHDETASIARTAADRLPFLRVLEMPQDGTTGDNEARLERAAEARAFNWALSQVEAERFTHIAKLDGDIELCPGYFRRLLEEFDNHPRLGVAGGAFAERGRRGWRRVRTPPHHVPGGLKVYSRECFEAIGGIREYLGWDTIDETSARMRGFETRCTPELVVRHHRSWGSVGGRLRGRARYGRCAYAARYPVAWVVARSLKIAATPPAGLSGVAFLFGYTRAAVRRVPRADRAYARFVRAELWARLASRRRAPVWPRGAD